MSYGDSLGHRRSYGLLFVVEQCSGRDIAINSPISASRSAGLRYWGTVCASVSGYAHGSEVVGAGLDCVDGRMRDDATSKRYLLA